MPLQLSGAISLLDIQGEFYGSAPIGINEYYENGGLVPPGAGLPTGGTISFYDFYGKTNTKYVTATSNTVLYNVNVRQVIVDAGWDQRVPAVYTIPNNTYITATSTSASALVVSGSFPNGLTIVNNGYILGRGGDGGYKTVGNPGGPGLQYEGPSQVTIANNGVIAGGGGGGGGGLPTDNTSAGGGAGGAAYGTSNYGAYYAGYVDAGLLTGGIAGGTLSPPYPGYGVDRWGYAGGNGGGPGQAGSPGGPARSCFTFYGTTYCVEGHAGGAAGNAVVQYRNGGAGINWSPQGDIRGGQLVA